MASRSCITWWSPYVNHLADIPKEQDELAGARFDAGSNKVLTLSKAPIPPFIPPSAKDIITKFIKMFIEKTQA